MTVADIAKTKQKSVVPDTFDKLVKLLQKYINFLHAAFGGLCPLSLVLRKMLSALKTYSEKQSITKTTIASILWIILLQSRHFALGQMQGKMAVIPEFKSLQDDIMAKRGQISHAELPVKFLEPAQPCKEGVTTGGTTTGSHPTGTDAPAAGTPAPSPGNRKHPKREQTVKIHPLVKKNYKKVSVSMLCTACGTSLKHTPPPGKCATAAISDHAPSFYADTSTSHPLTPKLNISSNNLHQSSMIHQKSQHPQVSHYIKNF